VGRTRLTNPATQSNKVPKADDNRRRAIAKEDADGGGNVNSAGGELGNVGLARPAGSGTAIVGSS